MTPQESAEYERWERDWKERFENPDGWERKRTEELQSARLVREAQEAESTAAWAALFHRPPWDRDSFSLDEIAKNARVPGQLGFDDVASDRILVEVFASVLHHDFDGSVLIWSDEAPHLITFDPERARLLQELGHDSDAATIRSWGFAEFLFLPRAVCKQWCDRNGLVLPPEWISEDTALLTEQPDRDHDAAGTLANQDEKIEPKRRVRGPKKGSGRYAGADRMLFPTIKKLVDEGMSVYGAVSQISDCISGNAELESKIRRVERRYRTEVLGIK
jgi:hypothetical protein